MRRPLVAALVVAALLTGCGDGGTTERTPATVVQALARVDQAVATRNWSGVRQALDDLVRRTVLARRSGELSAEHADRILAAAAELAGGLPRPTSAAGASSAPPSAPTPTATPRVAPSAAEVKAPDRKPRGKGKARGR